jgi:dTDP-D-glucose 4,6-dehydratase
VIEHVAARAGDQRRTAGNSERAREVLGWAPATGIDEALRRQARHALAARSGVPLAAASASSVAV